MNTDENKQLIYCAVVDENRVYCNNRDKLVIEGYYKNHLKSGTHIIIIHRKQRINIRKTNN